MAKGQTKPKLDNEKIVSKLEEAFALDCSVTEACYYADIARDTYYKLLKYKPKLKDKFDRLRQRPVLMARQAVVNGLKGNPEFSLKYLQNKRRYEFSTKTETGYTDNEGNDIPIESAKEWLTNKKANDKKKKTKKNKK